MSRLTKIGIAPRSRPVTNWGRSRVSERGDERPMIGAHGGGVVNEVGHAHYRERIKNHEVNSDTYSIIITASSLVLGYAT